MLATLQVCGPENAALHLLAAYHAHKLPQGIVPEGGKKESNTQQQMILLSIDVGEWPEPYTKSSHLGLLH